MQQENNLSETELLIYDALYRHMGARIEFQCDNVTYTGIIEMILPNIRTVKLRHTKIANEDHYFGNLRFKFHEITPFKVVESAESVNRIPRNDYLLNILRNSRPVPLKTMVQVLFNDKLSDNESEDGEPSDEKQVEEFVLDMPKHLKGKLPEDFVVIDSMSYAFYKAINHISKQSLIGVSFHGPDLSRFGRIVWLCIATEMCSFIFDIYMLGKETFVEGLKEILESNSVKKVIHDCRFPSDCLAHQYNIRLSNVFDVRIADFYISMQRYNDKYKLTSFGSLDFCLRTYLKVPQEFIYEREKRRSEANLDTFFNKRPISNAYLYDLLKSVLYLRLLYENLITEMLVPFRRAVKFYESVLAYSPTNLIDFLGYDLSRPDSIPPCMIMHGIQTVRFQMPKKLGNLICSFIHPQTGEVIASNKTLPPLTDGIMSIDLKGERKISSFCETLNSEKSQLSNNAVLKVPNDQSENFVEETENVIFSKPSLRQLDEVYHKLVHKMHQSESYVNAKPLVDNTFKCIDTKHSSLSSKADLDLSENANQNKLSSEESYIQRGSDESEIWEKIREETRKEKASYPYDFERERKIKYVPG